MIDAASLQAWGITAGQARVAADALLVLHAAFIAWAVGGALAVTRRPWLAAVHLPALAWAVWISASGGLCPLTPWEWALREHAGQGGHAGGWIEHHLVRWIYPDGLTRGMQLAMGAGVLLLNAVLYARLLRRRCGLSGSPPAGGSTPRFPR